MKASFDTDDSWERQIVAISLKARAELLMKLLEPEDACKSIRKEWKSDLRAIKRVYHYYSGKSI